MLEQGVDANLDPHGPALGMVWSGDPLAGDKELGGPQRPARSEVWTEGSCRHGAGGEAVRHEWVRTGAGRELEGAIFLLWTNEKEPP